MDALETIVRNGPDSKLTLRAYNALMAASDPQRRLIMADTLRGYLARWLELRGTYAVDADDESVYSHNPCFDPSGKPLVLMAITSNALGSCRFYLEGDELSEAIREYRQAESALKRFTRKTPLEAARQAIGRLTHKEDGFEALGRICNETSMLSSMPRKRGNGGQYDTGSHTPR